VKMSLDLGFRVAGHAIPMNLCARCSTMNMNEFLDSATSFHCSMYGAEHQPGFAALRTSALLGCDMCAMFLDGVIQVYCSENKCSEDTAYQVFNQLERLLHRAEDRLCLYRVKTTDFRTEIEGLFYQIPFKCADYTSAYFGLRNCRGE
jgi:hypothetical protein